MSPVFSADIIARVKDETDIVEIVRQHVELKQAGGIFKGLCPFHKEKSPSFIVTPGRQSYHCFGCGTGGDVISFLMEIEGLSFPEAIEVLARPLDIDLSSWLREDEGEGERRSFHRANEAATTLWREAFWDDRVGRAAREYLLGRGFGEKVLRDADVGWAVAEPGWLERGLAKAGVDGELARRADLLREGDRPGAFAYFRNRIIFPVRNISRQVAGFGGRVIDGSEPKYLNSADSPYFSIGRLLYGFDASRMAVSREKSAILVEGYLDLLALIQAGIPNVVATCGTAFTEEQAKLIRRGAPNVTLLFDGDKAGLKAAVRSADTALKAGLEPTIVRLPAGEDPASLVIGQGLDALREALAGGMGYIPFLHSLAERRGADRQVSERALRQALGTIAAIADPLRREYILQEAAAVFGLDAAVLRQSLDREADRRPAAARQRSAAAAEASDEPAPLPATPRSRGNKSRVKPHGLPDVERWEKDIFAHCLRDQSGEAARIYLAERGALRPRGEAAGVLADEIEAWGETRAQGGSGAPGEFVRERWNTVGDAAYRGYVSRLLSREEHPDQTDFGKAIRDCLERLRGDRRFRGD